MRPDAHKLAEPPPDAPLGAAFRARALRLARFRAAWGDCDVPCAPGAAPARAATGAVAAAAEPRGTAGLVGAASRGGCAADGSAQGLSWARRFAHRVSGGVQMHELDRGSAWPLFALHRRDAALHACRRSFWEDPELGEWVSLMRKAQSERRLTPAQRAALDGLGFSWKVRVRGFVAFAVPGPAWRDHRLMQKGLAPASYQTLGGARGRLAVHSCCGCSSGER